MMLPVELRGDRMAEDQARQLLTKVGLQDRGGLSTPVIRW